MASYSVLQVPSSGGRGLPPHMKTLVEITRRIAEVTHQLVTLQPDQPLVRHFSVQRPVLYRLTQSLVPVRYHNLPPGLRQVTATQMLFKVPGCHFPGFEQAENHPVHQERLKHFGQIQGQRKTTVAGLVQVGDGRVQGGAVNLAQDRRVAKRVAERNERIEFVGRRTAFAFVERKTGGNFLPQKQRPELIVAFADAAFYRHQGRNGRGEGKRLAVSFQIQ